MDKIILHSDLNNFYASVECRDDDRLRGIPVAVCGDVENRHGIVLAKNELAKACGVKTGEALWEARTKCPDITFVRAHFHKYRKAASDVKHIYYQYTDLVENFGLDECWLDVTGSYGLFGSGIAVADEIRKRIKKELGLTVSIGVSFNKVFAKLGSDMKKPDATTMISRENYRDKVWPLPASELIYVGRATDRKLRDLGILTIGEIAKAPRTMLIQKFGKHSETLWSYANGMDTAPVRVADQARAAKTIGNSSTAYRDLETEEDVKILLWSLSECVAARLREAHLKCTSVAIYIRDNELKFYERQKQIPPSCTAKQLFEAAFALYRDNPPERAIRSMGIRTGNLQKDDLGQLSLFDDGNPEIRYESLESEIDRLTAKYGSSPVHRCVSMLDRRLTLAEDYDDSLQTVAFVRDV